MAGRAAELEAFYTQVLTDRLEEATEYLQEYIRETVSTLYPPSSTPGHPPHRRSGALYHGINAHPVERHGTELIGAVGSHVPGESYPAELEFGRARVAARPYMRPGLVGAALGIQKIMAEP